MLKLNNKVGAIIPTIDNSKHLCYDVKSIGVYNSADCAIFIKIADENFLIEDDVVWYLGGISKMKT